MLSATLPCDSDAAMVHAYHPPADKSTRHAAPAKGRLSGRGLVEVKHGAPCSGASHRAPGAFVSRESVHLHRVGGGARS